MGTTQTTCPVARHTGGSRYPAGRGWGRRGRPGRPARRLRHRPQDNRSPVGPIPPHPQVRPGLRRGRCRLPRRRAAVFHGEDKKNDDDEEVRYWISGEVVDAYGKYIWEYAPAYPRSIRRKLRPKRRRRSREPGTAPKAESIWMKRPSDKMREAGIKPPKRTLMWI